LSWLDAVELIDLRTQANRVFNDNFGSLLGRLEMSAKTARFDMPGACGAVDDGVLVKL